MADSHRQATAIIATMLSRDGTWFYGRIRHNEFEGDDLAGAAPMRDWLLILAPIAAIGYFLTYPSEFTALMNWFARLLR